MALSMTCKNCDKELTGETEDEFVANVQEHVLGHSREHGGGEHLLSREQVLARLAREQSRTDNR